MRVFFLCLFCIFGEMCYHLVPDKLVEPMEGMGGTVERYHQRLAEVMYCLTVLDMFVHVGRHLWGHVESFILCCGACA